VRIIEARVKRCQEEHTIIDKKLRKRSWSYRRYFIPLNDDQPFENEDTVKILSLEDFKRLKIHVSRVKEENDRLKLEIEKLNLTIDKQKNQIAFLEKEEKNDNFSLLNRLKALL